MYWTITNLKDPHGFARKVRRWMEQGGSKYNDIKVRRGTVYAETTDDKRPWSELAGHMTNSTEIVPSHDDPLDN